MILVVRVQCASSLSDCEGVIITTRNWYRGTAVVALHGGLQPYGGPLLRHCLTITGPLSRTVNASATNKLRVQNAV